MPGFITDEDLQSLIEGELKVNAGTLTTNVPAWATIISQANAQAFADIVEAFLMRGFTMAQIMAWDNGTTRQGEIALYEALVAGAGLHGYDDKFIERYKVDPNYLADVLLVSGGAIT